MITEPFYSQVRSRALNAIITAMPIRIGITDSIRSLPKFSRKSTDAGSNRRHLTYGTGPTMACSHEGKLVLKAPCQHDNLRTDAERDTKDDVMIVPGNRMAITRFDRSSMHYERAPC
jgi:hypothetical protein